MSQRSELFRWVQNPFQKGYKIEVQNVVAPPHHTYHVADIRVPLGLFTIIPVHFYKHPLHISSEMYMKRFDNNVYFWGHIASCINCFTLWESIVGFDKPICLFMGTCSWFVIETIVLQSMLDALSSHLYQYEGYFIGVATFCLVFLIAKS